jgi:hypothetical protein
MSRDSKAITRFFLHVDICAMTIGAVLTIVFGIIHGHMDVLVLGSLITGYFTRMFFQDFKKLREQ